jgi:hypothetical protein
MSDPTELRLRQLAEALVSDDPRARTLDGAADEPYLDRRPREPRRGRGRVLAAAAVVATMVVAGGVGLAQGRSSTADVDAASGLLTPTTVPTPERLDHLLEGSYQLSRGSIDDPTQNIVTGIDAADVPIGAISADDALAAAPTSPCADAPACDPPFSVARLARYQGFGGYDSFEDVDGPGAGDLRHDVVVWVLVRHGDDLALAAQPGNHRMVVALLIDATTGELVSAGTLLPAD